jgi:hypothetical protein
MKIPLNYKVEDMWAVDTYTIKEGLMVKKASEEHPDKTKRKLIIANKASFAGAFIDEGKLNLTGNHKFYILGDKLELFLKMLNYKILNIISHYTKYGQDFLDNEAFTYIPDIRKLNIDNIEELEFYKLIGLTDEEIKLFKNTKELVSNNEDNSDSDTENIIKPKKTIRKNKIIEVDDEPIEVKPIKTVRNKKIIEIDDESILEIKKPNNNIIKKSIIQPIDEIQIDVPVIKTKKLNKQKSKNFIKDKF